MNTDWHRLRLLGKFIFVAVALSGCSTNPATGEQQFTALLPASQEASVGASEHQKVRETYGDFVTGPLADYVSSVGRKVAQNTERTDVNYKFFVIDSPEINAFAIPGGYVYTTRGLLALANSESELAAVLGHEIGHITARHSAERASQGFLVGLGAAVLGAATGSSGVAQAANVGSDLLIKSYSRGQEHQADELGVRYLNRNGYDTYAMAGFLSNLDAQTKLDARIAGKQSNMPSYFSTHPVTAERVAQASAEAAKYPKGQGAANQGNYYSAINGMTYGDSADQGFVRGRTFYHPGLGFAFDTPQGYQIQNTANTVVGVNQAAGSAIIFDAVNDKSGRDPLAFLTQGMMKGEPIDRPESITINGMRAATAGFSGSVNNQPATIRIVLVEWKPGQFFRFQMAFPPNAPAAVVDGLKRTTYSLRRLTDAEKSSVRPARIAIVTAGAGDTVSTLSSRMAFDDYREERFRVLNGLKGGENVTAGRAYKVVAE